MWLQVKKKKCAELTTLTISTATTWSQHPLLSGSLHWPLNWPPCLHPCPFRVHPQNSSHSVSSNRDVRIEHSSTRIPARAPYLIQSQSQRLHNSLGGPPGLGSPSHWGHILSCCLLHSPARLYCFPAIL
ncbi:hypothetical protein H1C71_004935 [Ictidomys tridecemlineatus]|nr:hypothetical protein H1C71_004935 [Ictidomys tridecemlineatus]KAG3278074.1 hypothetical protein H1C71_004935 [Ictidomys tridecemlineatus]KAG3278075.1 hypothetical protein H1C71_004935 [Ictidomys tridecemlineatus]